MTAAQLRLLLKAEADRIIAERGTPTLIPKAAEGLRDFVWGATDKELIRLRDLILSHKK